MAIGRSSVITARWRNFYRLHLHLRVGRRVL